MNLWKCFSEFVTHALNYIEAPLCTWEFHIWIYLVSQAYMEMLSALRLLELPCCILL